MFNGYYGELLVTNCIIFVASRFRVDLLPVN